MRAGKFSTLVTFLGPFTSRDPDSNEELVTWAEVGKAWAEVEAKSAPEFFDGTQRHAQTILNCRFRASEVTAFDATMRVSIDGAGELVIKGILPDVTGRGETIIQAVAGAGAD